MGLDRVLERIIMDSAKDGDLKEGVGEGINGRAIRVERIARHVLNGLKEEIDRDPTLLEDLGMGPASLSDEDGQAIDCWVFI